MDNTTVENTEKTETKKTEKKVIWSTGRRKTAVARIRLVTGTGQITINNRSIDNYLGGHGAHKVTLMQILKYVPKMSDYDIFISVSGGGMTGQVGATRLGIARALSELDPSLRPKLKQGGFLRRDPRMVERKKAGQPKARKKFQWTKR